MMNLHRTSCAPYHDESARRQGYERHREKPRCRHERNASSDRSTVSTSALRRSRSVFDYAGKSRRVAELDARSRARGILERPRCGAARHEGARRRCATRRTASTAPPSGLPMHGSCSTSSATIPPPRRRPSEVSRRRAELDRVARDGGQLQRRVRRAQCDRQHLCRRRRRRRCRLDAMLARMYLRWAEAKHFPTQIVDESPAEEAGLKSLTFFVRGRNAYGLLESERGVHRLVRLSPFDAAHRRHTSFAAVDVIPEIEAGEGVRSRSNPTTCESKRSNPAAPAVSTSTRRSRPCASCTFRRASSSHRSRSVRRRRTARSR